MSEPRTMDGNRFDQISKLIGAGASRRSILKGLLGLSGAAVAASARPSGADARTIGSRPTIPPPSEPVCTPGHQFCGGEGAAFCCPPGRCFDGRCCPDDETEGCGDSCCPVGQCTTSGACCATGHPCGTICCPDGSSCGRNGNTDICCGGSVGGVPCGYECCPTAEQCCDLECCPPGSICIGEALCCPPDLICGTVCCNGPGRQCCDEICLQTGQCCGDGDCQHSPSTCQTAFCDNDHVCQLSDPCAGAAPGTVCCGGACIHLGSTSHCRFCDEACAPGDLCTEQGCVSPTTTTTTTTVPPTTTTTVQPTTTSPPTTTTTVTPTTTTPPCPEDTFACGPGSTGQSYCCPQDSYSMCCGGPESECCGRVGVTGVVRECDANGHCCEAGTPFHCPATGSGQQGCCATPCISDMCVLETTTVAPTTSTPAPTTSTAAPTTSTAAPTTTTTSTTTSTTTTTTTSTTTSTTTTSTTSTTPRPGGQCPEGCPDFHLCCLDGCINFLVHDCCPSLAEEGLELPNFLCECGVCAKDAEDVYRCGPEIVADNGVCVGNIDDFANLFLGVCCDGVCGEIDSCPETTTTGQPVPTTTTTTVQPTTTTSTTTSTTTPPTTLPPITCSNHDDCGGDSALFCCLGECVDPAVHSCCPNLDGRSNGPCGCQICAKDDAGVYQCGSERAEDDEPCALTLNEQGVCCAGACLNQQSCVSTTPPPTTTTPTPVLLAQCEVDDENNRDEVRAACGAEDQLCLKGGCVSDCNNQNGTCAGYGCTCEATWGGTSQSILWYVCSGEPTAIACQFHTDCPDGYYCELDSRTCIPACVPSPPPLLCDNQLDCGGQPCFLRACATSCDPEAENDVCASVGCTCLQSRTPNSYCGEALGRPCDQGNCPHGEFCQPDNTCARQCFVPPPTTTTPQPTSTTPGPDFGFCASCPTLPDTGRFLRPLGDTCLDDDGVRAPCLCGIGICNTNGNICCDPRDDNAVPRVCVEQVDRCPQPTTTTTTRPPCGGPCSSGMTCCDDQCVDLLDDHRNCGMCDRVCAQGQDTCRSGECICPNLTGPCLVGRVVNCIPECSRYEVASVYAGVESCLNVGSSACSPGACACCIREHMLGGICSGHFELVHHLAARCGFESLEMCHPPGPCLETCPPGVPCLPSGFCAEACGNSDECGPCGECEDGFCAPLCEPCEICNPADQTCDPVRCLACQVCVNDVCVDDCPAPLPGSCFENYCHPSGFCGSREDCTRSAGCCPQPNFICNSGTRKCECAKPCPDGSCAPADGCCAQEECLTDFRNPNCRICGDDHRCHNVNCGQQCSLGLCCDNFGHCTECRSGVCPDRCLGLTCNECEFCHQGVCRPITIDRDPCCDINCDRPFTVCDNGQCICQEGMQRCLISDNDNLCGRPPLSICEHDYECCNGCVSTVFGKFCV